MSAQGYTKVTVQAPGRRIAVVAASWHERIMQGLIDGALREISQAKAQAVLWRVPGSFELPGACQQLLSGDYDAAVALGVIMRGGTPHFEYVAMAATNGLTQVSLSTGKPVGFGVLTIENEQQGLDRAGLPGSPEDKGAEAAEAVLRMLTLQPTEL